nr:hypothetical protein [Methylobacterium nodulans]
METRQHAVGSVRFNLGQLRPLGIVKAVDDLEVLLEGQDVCGLVDIVVLPQSVAVAKSLDPGTG